MFYIKKRGRKYERNISDNYLKSIETRYFNYINKQNSYNVLILDVTNVNFIKDQSIYAEIIAEINKFDTSAHELPSPPHSPHSSTTASPPHSPLQSVSTVQFPSQS